MQNVESEFCLRDESIPKMNGEVFVGTAQPSNEMIFECSNCPFGSIAAMEVGWDQLEINAFISQKILEHPGCFIVEVL